MPDLNPVTAQILAADAGRLPDGLAVKYRRMAQDPWDFMRATVALFYQDWPTTGALPPTPTALVCGDLHVENFGCFRTTGTAVRFGVNDYDQAGIAPVSVDVVRLLTSIFIALQQTDQPEKTLKAAGRALLDGYVQTLTHGHAPNLEVAHIQDLQRKAGQQTPAMVLEKHTRGVGRDCRLIRGVKSPPVSTQERAQMEAMVDFYNRQHPEATFVLQDATRRLAGMGGLGLPRFMLLVRAQESEALLLWEVRSCRASVLETVHGQPDFGDQAQRVVALQRLGQGGEPPHLLALPNALRLSPLQPGAINLTLPEEEVDLALMTTLGQVMAAAHQRGAGHHGAAPLARLRSFAPGALWQAVALDFALDRAVQGQKQWQAFAVDYEQGLVVVPGLGQGPAR